MVARRAAPPAALRPPLPRLRLLTLLLLVFELRHVAGLDATGGDDRIGGGGMDESGSPKGPPWHSPLQMLRSRPDLSRMAALVDATPGLAGALDNDVLMATLLLPTNDAFREAFPANGGTAGRLEMLLHDERSAAALSLLHVISSEVVWVDRGTALYHGMRTMAALGTLPTYSRHELTVGSDAEAVLVDELDRTARIIEADVPCGKSSCHVLDKVLIPGFRTIVELLDNNPTGTLGATSLAIKEAWLPACYREASMTVTLLAPTDEAWRRFAERRGQPLSELLMDGWLMSSILKQMTFKGAPLEALAGRKVVRPLSGSAVDVQMLAGLAPDTAAEDSEIVPRIAVAADVGDEHLEARVVAGPLRGLGKWVVYAVDEVLHKQHVDSPNPAAEEDD